MLPATGVTKLFSSHPPNVVEVQSSMCQASQLQISQPVARWILEEGQLLGVLVAAFPAPVFRTSSCS